MPEMAEAGGRVEAGGLSGRVGMPSVAVLGLRYGSPVWFGCY